MEITWQQLGKQTRSILNIDFELYEFLWIINLMKISHIFILCSLWCLTTFYKLSRILDEYFMGYKFYNKLGC